MWSSSSRIRARFRRCAQNKKDYRAKIMEPVTIAYICFAALWIAGAITYL